MLDYDWLKSHRRGPRHLSHDNIKKQGTIKCANIANTASNNKTSVCEQVYAYLTLYKHLSDCKNISIALQQLKYYKQEHWT